MAIFDSIREIFSRNRTESENLDTSFGTPLMRMAQYESNARVRAMFDFLSDCNGNYESLDGKTQAKVSKLMLEAFPFVKRALGDMVALVGNVSVVASLGEEVDESQIDELNKLAEQFNIYSEFDPEAPQEKGFNNLVARAAMTLLNSGLLVTQSRYQDGRLGEYQGGMIFDSMNFEFVYDYTRQRLTYLDNQYVENTAFTHICGWDYRNSAPWPHPITSGGEFFTDLMLALFVAVRNTARRKGAPIEASIIAIKNPSDIKTPEGQKLVKATIESWNSKLQSAAIEQARGIPTNVTGSIPTDINLLSQAFGASYTDEVNPDLLTQALIQFANLLRVPPELVGIVFGSSGFSPERFKLLRDLWGGLIDDIRSKLHNNLWSLLLHHYRACGVSPELLERVELQFVNVDTTDPEKAAGISKTRSEAASNWITVAQEIQMLDGEAAQTILEREIIAHYAD